MSFIHMTVAEASSKYRHGDKTNNRGYLTCPSSPGQTRITQAISGTYATALGALKGTPLPIRVTCLAIGSLQLFNATKKISLKQ